MKKITHAAGEPSRFSTCDYGAGLRVSTQPGETTLPGDKQLEDAVRLLESHPDFARVQLRMRDRLEETERNAPAETRAYGSRARLEHVLLRFEIRAQAFLELVSDMHMQNAYMVVLHSLVRLPWEEFTGAPPDVMRPASDQAETDLYSIQVRMAVWIKAGYQRLANPDQEKASSPGDSALEPSTQLGLQEAGRSKGTERRAAVDAYIAEVRQKTGEDITRVNIWKAAGYRTRSEFERWERDDPERLNKTADRRITQILTNKPHLKKN